MAAAVRTSPGTDFDAVIEQLQGFGGEVRNELHRRIVAGWATWYSGGCHKLFVSIRRFYQRSTDLTDTRKPVFKTRLNKQNERGTILLESRGVLGSLHAVTVRQISPRKDDRRVENNNYDSAITFFIRGCIRRYPTAGSHVEAFIFGCRDMLQRENFSA